MPTSSPSRRRVPEILSPAGDWDALRAAVANGADAVYFGLEQFNARHRAHNFSLEELSDVMRYLHERNVKGFVTFNILIFSEELPAAADYIRKIAEAGVDAVIVQDLGAVGLIRAVAPHLSIHGSTQMTLTEPRGVEFVRSLGVDRVVLARELSLADIGAIALRTPMELEVFIHGALCVAYSGQCLTSESIGGRSANRGQCAQACRLPYDLVVDGITRDMGDVAYLLSPQDLAAHDLVDDLAELGVSCLKIEGRLKSAVYVAATTSTYRKAVDAARAGDRGFAISPQARNDLQQTFSRGFGHGFLDGVDHQALVVGRFPKSRGVRVGTVSHVTHRRSVVIDLDSAVLNSGVVPLKNGDGIVFDEGRPAENEIGGRIFAVIQRPGGKQVEIELGRDVDTKPVPARSIVWKTDDPAMRRRLEQSFAGDVAIRGRVHRAPLRAEVRARVGEPLSITLRETSRANVVTVTSDQPLQLAQKFPLDEATLREQLGRLGDTPFELAELSLDIVDRPMAPKSVLNDLRRRAVEMLIAQRASGASSTVVSDPVAALKQLREACDLTPSPCTRGEGGGEGQRELSAGIFLSTDRSSKPSLRVQKERVEAVPAEQPAAPRSPSVHVLVRTLDQLIAVLRHGGANRPASVYCDFEDVRRYADAVDRCRAVGMPITLATLRVVKPGEDGFLKQVSDANPDALLVRNLAAIAFYREAAPHLPLAGDYALNVANELTAKLFFDAGLSRLVPSYDLNWRQMSAMLSRSNASRFECVIHQHMPMFHMEHCVFAHTLSDGKDYRDCGRPCESHSVDLRDRVGQLHPLIPDVGCRNTLFNAQAQSAMEFLPRMLDLGIGHVRIELLRESAAEVGPLLDQYGGALAGRSDPRESVRSLRVLHQLGVTNGTFDRE